MFVHCRQLIRIEQPHADENESSTALRVVQRARPSRYDSGEISGFPLRLYAPANEHAIDDVQMFADFFEKHYPPSVKVWRQTTYLRSLVDFTPTTLILKRAVRTIGLIHLAAVTQDARLVQESRISYGRLLGMLQFSLMFPSKIQPLSEAREMVASIALLTHISDDPAISPDSDDSWTAHMMAAQQVCDVRSLAALPNQELLLDQGMMRHVFMNGFFLSLAKRNAKNPRVDSIRIMKSNGWTTLIPAYHRLPGLLEDTDKALAEKADVITLLTIVARLQNILEETAGLFSEVRSPPTIDSALISDMDSTAEEHLVMADSTTFPQLFVPMTKEGGADLLKLFFITMIPLMVHCTILRIWHFRPETLGASPESAQRDTEERAYELARKSCKLSLSFTQNDKVVYISMLRLLLMLARNVFEQQDRLPEMGWCDACLIASKLRMQRVRATASPTLCKIEDITPGLAEAGRYKVKFDRRAFVVRAARTPSMRLLQ